MRKWTAIWMLAARAQGPWALAAILISTALVAAAFFLAAPEGVAAAGGVEAAVADRIPGLPRLLPDVTYRPAAPPAWR